MDRIEQIKKFFQHGWQIYQTVEETVNKLTDEQLTTLQKLYAAFHGLSSLADVFSHLREIRFCRHPDTMQAQATRCKWPDGNITWDIQETPAGIPKQKYVDCATEALARWARVCGIRPVYTPGNPQARIMMSVRAIDGAFGVLAESELPCGNVRQCHQWYDTGENWAIFDGPGSGPSLDIVRVMTHELGHALGMNHIGAGNLLAPTYSQQIWIPQAGDIQEMVARYGNPVAQDPPPSPPPPIPGADDEYVIRLKGKLSVDGWRLTKLLEAA